MPPTPQSLFTPPLLTQASRYAFAIGALLFARSVFPGVYLLDWAAAGLGLCALLTLWPRLSPRRRLLLAVVCAVMMSALTLPKSLSVLRSRPATSAPAPKVNKDACSDTPEATVRLEALARFRDLCRGANAKTADFRLALASRFTSVTNDIETVGWEYRFVSVRGPLRYTSLSAYPCGEPFFFVPAPTLDDKEHGHNYLGGVAWTLRHPDARIPVPAIYRTLIEREIARQLREDEGGYSGLSQTTATPPIAAITRGSREGFIGDATRQRPLYPPR